MEPSPLQLLNRTVPNKKKTKRPNVIVFVLKFVFGSVALIILPVAVLLRTATYLHLYHNVNHWLALACGAFVTAGVLAIYATLISVKFGGRRKFSTGRLKFFSVLVIVACVYSLLYTSGANFKSESVRATYRSLHPLLRMSTAALFLIDADAVVTDISRAPGDYARMGLSINENSLHFEQSDGYVHAIDLRTRGRTGFRNIIVSGFFRLMGYNSLRHVGTADHLHISIRNRTG